jgi:hypothetical protein
VLTRAHGGTVTGGVPLAADAGRYWGLNAVAPSDLKGGLARGARAMPRALGGSALGLGKALAPHIAIQGLLRGGPALANWAFPPEGVGR